MTNNPTIDGVSRELRELLERVVGKPTGKPNWDALDETRIAAAEEIRALLAAPAVERQEPVTMKRQYLTVPGLWIECADDDPQAMTFYKQTPEVAALQSTIARLEARVAELESGRGEPVAWLHTMHFEEGYGYQSRITVSPDNAFGKPGLNYDALFRVTSEPLFTAPPAPVATLWEICMPDEPGNPESPCEYVYVNSVAGRDLLLLREGSSVYAEYACLDATAALNGVKS